MKIKFALPILILGFIMILFGALFKLESWELANEMLILGVVMCTIPIALLLSKAFSSSESKQGMKFKAPILIVVAGVVLTFLGHFLNWKAGDMQVRC